MKVDFLHRDRYLLLMIEKLQWKKKKKKKEHAHTLCISFNALSLLFLLMLLSLLSLINDTTIHFKKIRKKDVRLCTETDYCLYLV